MPRPALAPLLLSTLILSLASLIAGSASAATIQRPDISPAQWKAQQKAAFEKSERIFVQAQKRNGLLTQYDYMVNAYNEDNSPAFRILFSQYLSWYQTYVGDYPAARLSYSIQQVSERDDAPSPLQAGYSQRPAIDALLEMVKDRKAVFFNEAHNQPITRTLTIRMLEPLRRAGFTHFAAETLYETDAGLEKRGYANSDSGFYVEEPLYGEMIREAIRLGFKIVAYEAVVDPRGDAREREQARHLYDRVFRRDPNARLVVNAGYAHIQKFGKYLDGLSMAYYFKKNTDIDPFCIEQTMMIEHDRLEHDHPYYRSIMQAGAPAAPVVYADATGKPWSLKPNYDVSVIFPPDVIRRERPTWLDVQGMRRPYPVGRDVCANQFPCLIEARYANEGDDAIPADRIRLTYVEKTLTNMLNPLYLRPGRYRLTATSIDNRVITRSTITVASGAPRELPQ